jgi:prepilin-type N-terminal cleavage/methylation domain-containing protein
MVTIKDNHLIKFINKSGYSLIELLIATVVAGIVASLAFMVFTNLQKDFRFQNSHAERVREMILTKKKIESALSHIEKVKSYTVTSVTYNQNSSDSICIIQFKNGSLLNGSSEVCKKLSKFRFEFVESQDDNLTKKSLLLWEGELERGGWIGGHSMNNRNESLPQRAQRTLR